MNKIIVLAAAAALALSARTATAADYLVQVSTTDGKAPLSVTIPGFQVQKKGTFNWNGKRWRKIVARGPGVPAKVCDHQGRCVRLTRSPQGAYSGIMQ
ncbi:hypothetical protein H6783_01300 [Candidatus Nomurabacteria bacterium]|nr:hypothetical protein [Candidatus Nomurabacteria bacterium]